MTTATPLYLELDNLLQSAREFLGWRYRFQLKSGGVVAMPRPTYPRRFLDTFGQPILGNLYPDYQRLAQGEQRATNCVMFGEGLILGAAALGGAGRGLWTFDHHMCAMQASGKGPRGVIEAYVSVGLADRVRNGKCEPPGAGDHWFIVQNDHHFWVVVDYDPGTARCLTLEANVFIATIGAGEVGFVGHNWRGDKGDRLVKAYGQMAWGMPLDLKFTGTATVDGWKQHGPTWKFFIANTKELYWAKLHVRAGKRYFAPLTRSVDTSAVISSYSNNEKKHNGFGGYYVLGLHRNIHGGVHLWPEPDQRGSGQLAKVRAMAPGYIVAARLPPLNHPANDSDVLEYTHGWSGFVLVRHELAVTQGSSSSRYPFYSLYMHLRPPSFLGPPSAPDPYLRDKKPAKPAAIAGDGPGPEIPWFHRLDRLRRSVSVRVRRAAPQHGQPEPPLGEVLDGHRASSAAARGDTAITSTDFLAIPPPFDVDAVLAALRDGKVVTFSEPLVPVGSGEGIGWLSGLDDVHGLRRQSNRIDDGFLHFQVFAPAVSGNGIDALVQEIERIDDLDMKFQSVNESALGGRFPEPGIFKAVVQAPLHEDEAAALQHVFDDLVNNPDLGLHDATGFVNSLDAANRFAPDGWDTSWDVCDEHCYPVKVDLDVTYLPIGNGQIWQIEFEFRDARGEVVGKALQDITNRIVGAVPRTAPANLVIQVPAAADSVTIRPVRSDVAAMTIDGPSQELQLFRTMLHRRRWRDVRLTTDNEWAPEVVAETIDAINHCRAVTGPSPRIARIDEPLSKKIARAYWCTPSLEAPASRRLLVDGKAAQESRIMSALSRQIVALHPLTAVWSLALLSRRLLPDGRKVSCADTFDSTPHGGTDTVPAWWSWVLEPGVSADRLTPGERLAIIVVSDDFRYGGTSELDVEVECSGKTLTIAATAVPQSPGVYTAELRGDFWRTCVLRRVRGGTPRNTIHGKSIEAVLEVTVPGDPPSFTDWNDDERRRGLHRFVGRRGPAELCFAVKFESDAPAMLNGYAWLRWRRAGSTEAPVEGMSRQLARMDSVTALLAAAKAARRTAGKPGAFVNHDDFEHESSSNEVIVRRRSELVKQVTAHYSWRAYVHACSDVHLACSLAERIQQLTDALRPRSILVDLKRGGLRGDGLACRLIARSRGKPAGGARPPSPADRAVQLAEAARRVGLSALVANSDSGECEVRFDSAPEPAELCPSVAAAKLSFADPSRCFIRCAASGPANNAPVTGSFELARYRNATDGSSIRIPVALAEALELLRIDARVDLPLVYLSRDGLTCRVSVPRRAKQVIHALAARYFLGVVDVSGSRTYCELTVPPTGRQYGIVTVDPGQLLRDMEAELGPCGAGRFEYLWAFQPMVLFHKQNKAVYFPPAGKPRSAKLDRQEPEDKQRGTSRRNGDAYADLLAGCPTLTPFEARYAAGEFEPVGFPPDDTEGKLFHVAGGPSGRRRLLLEVPVQGSVATWAHYQIGVTVGGKRQKMCPRIASTGRMTVDCGELRDSSDAGASIHVQLDTTLHAKSDLPQDFPLPRPFSATYSRQSQNLAPRAAVARPDGGGPHDR